MKRSALIIIAILLATLALSRAPAEPGKKFVLNSAKWSRLPVGEGGVAILNLEVAYYGDESLLDVKAKLSLKCGAKVIPPDTVIVGSWDPGTVKILTFLVNTSGVFGECPATLYINYEGVARRRAFGYETVAVHGDGSIDFKLSFYGNPSVSVSISPSTVVGDTLNVLTITLRNAGTGDALDFSATITFTGAAVLDVEQPLKVKADKLSPGESVEAKVSLIPFSQQVSMNVKADYVDAYGNNRIDQFTVMIPTASGAAVVILAQPNRLKAGSSNTVTLEVRNIGDTPLKNAILQIHAVQNSQMVIEPQFIELGDLEPGESKKFDVVVSVPNIAMGAQNIAYTLTYRNEQGTKISIKDSFNVFVVEQAQLAITSVEVVPSKPKVGDTVIVSLTLINLGSQALNRVNVTAEPSQALKPLRKTYYFLGQVQPQSPMSVPFSFKALNSGRHVVEFKAVCEDIYGVEWTITKTLEIEILEKAPLNSGEEKERPMLGDYLIPVVAALAVAALAFYIFSRRKRGR